VQLFLEYDPEPPFRCGHPDVAPPELAQEIKRRLRARFERVRSAAG